MTDQLQLAIKTAKPVITPAEIEHVCRLLFKKQGWVMAKVMEAENGIDDRTLRLAAEHSDGRILSGQKGYRYFDRTTTIEEADRAATWLESQGRKMLNRGGAIRRRMHRYAWEKNVTPADVSAGAISGSQRATQAALTLGKVST